MANLTDADKVLRNDTGKDIASKLDDIKSAILGQSTTLNNLSDVSILSVQDGQFLKYDSTEGKWVNVSLPDPMVFKGTLGTSGTITALPVDGSANVGDTYKVIEDGTYSGTSAKVGDLFSCLTKTSIANTWVLIPSGDESFTDTWRGIKVNGTEKLTNSISSGEIDFVAGSNIQISFDTTGNKIIISATDTTYNEATQSTSGLMSASDKTKLDTIPTTADTQPITTGSVVNTKEYIDDKTTFVKSASGSLVHITDGADNIPVKSLVSEIVAVQDLHGYDKPWVGGAGKNLLPNEITSYTEAGVTFTTMENGKIKINGTSTANIFQHDICENFSLPEGTYILSYDAVANLSVQICNRTENQEYFNVNAQVTSRTFTVTSEMVNDMRVRFIASSNRTFSNAVTGIMIRLASETDATFEPYSNICPITGFDSGKIGVTNDNIEQLWTIDSSFRGEVNFNQLAKQLSTENGYFFDNASGNINDGIANITANRSQARVVNHTLMDYKKGHKYFVSLNCEFSRVTTIQFQLSLGGSLYLLKNLGAANQTAKKLSGIVTDNRGEDGIHWGGFAYIDAQSGDTGKMSEFEIIDLTQLFGEEIADYIYNLEQSQAGAGVEFFKAIYPQEYYPYNVGTSELVGENTNTYIVAFGQTVYGGKLNVITGELVSEYIKVDLSNLTFTYNSDPSNLRWASNSIADIIREGTSEIPHLIAENYDTVSIVTQNNTLTQASITAYNGKIYCRNLSDTTPPSGYVIYKVTNPTSLTLSGVAPKTLSGINNIYSNCGDVEVTYYTNKSNDILEFVDSEIGKKNGTNIPIEGNSQDSIKTYVDDKTTLVKSASGDIITITDGGDNIPLKSCEITINPDLSGKTECNLVVCNKNLYAPTSASQSVSGITCTNNNDGTYTCSNQATQLQQFSLGNIKLPAGTYVLSGCPIGGSLTTFDLRWTNSYIDTGSGVIITSDGNTTSHVVITIRNGYNCGSGITFKPMICKVDTPNPDYAHFEKKSATTYNIPFGTTVYGGSGNALTGKFVSEWGKYTITNDTILNTYNTSEYGSWARVSQIGVQKIDNTNIMAFCDIATGIPFNRRTATANQRRVYTDDTGYVVIRAAATDNITSLEDLKNLFMGANICYVLATPTSLTLSGVTPKTLSGINNIYNDCGDTAIEYFTSSADGLAALIEVLSNS